MAVPSPPGPPPIIATEIGECQSIFGHCALISSCELSFCYNIWTQLAIGRRWTSVWMSRSHAILRLDVVIPLVHRSDVSDEHSDEFCIVLCVLIYVCIFSSYKIISGGGEKFIRH